MGEAANTSSGNSECVVERAMSDLGRQKRSEYLLTSSAHRRASWMWSLVAMQYLSLTTIAACLFLGASSCAPAKPPIQKAEVPLCLPETATKAASVVMLATYEGGFEPVLKPGQKVAANDPMQEYIEVVKVRGAADTNGDIVLVLGSYEDLTWDLSALTQSKIRGVILYGDQSPKVRGLNDNIPVRVATRISPNAACGKPLVPLKGGMVLNAFVEQVQRVTGLKVSKFIGGYENSEFDIGISQEAAVERTLKANVLADRGLSPDNSEGRYGARVVQQLVKSGSIRPATQANIDQWNTAASKKIPTHSLSPYASDYVKTGYTFVVLKRFVLPSGMQGPASRLFIVPPGVPKPTTAGNKASGNGIYSTGDGTCTGPMDECQPGGIGAVGRSGAQN